MRTHALKIFFSPENLTFQEKPNALRQAVFILAFLRIGANIIEFQGKKTEFCSSFFVFVKTLPSSPPADSIIVLNKN